MGRGEEEEGEEEKEEEEEEEEEDEKGKEAVFAVMDVRGWTSRPAISQLTVRKKEKKNLCLEQTRPIAISRVLTLKKRHTFRL